MILEIDVLVALTVAPGDPPAPAKISLEEAVELARTVTPRVEEIRGLKFKRPVAVRVVDDQTARRHFEARIAKEYPEARLRADERAYAQLGLIPAGTQLLTGFLDILEEQAGGFYDPESDTFYVLDDMPKAVGPVLVAHELTHALDDQHYGIDGMLDQVKEDDDRAAAVGAVVEGSGTLVMTAFLMQEMQAGRLQLEALAELQKSEAGQGARLTAALPFLRRSLLSSYALGFPFLLRGDLLKLTSFDPADLNRAFEKPPASSEQILHPEKYWEAAKADAPVAVAMPDLAKLLGPGWALAGHGTLGELNLALLTDAPTPNGNSPDAMVAAAWTNDAAAGIGGDAYQHYANGAKGETVLATVWDTEKDAVEFEKALRPLPDRRAYRRRAAVVVVAGDVPRQVEALVSAVFAGLKGSKSAE